MGEKAPDLNIIKQLTVEITCACGAQDAVSAETASETLRLLKARGWKIRRHRNKPFTIVCPDCSNAKREAAEAKRLALREYKLAKEAAATTLKTKLSTL